MNKKILIERQEKKIIRLAQYLLIVNIVSIIIMFITNQLYSVNEYLPIKVIKGYIFFVTNAILLILLTNLQSKLDEKKVFYPFFITFIILFVILIIEKINPNLLNIFHVNNLYNEKYGRIRLLTGESSYTSTLIILNFILAFFYSNYIKKNKLISFVLICMLIIFIQESTSKGFLLTILISMAIIILSSKKIKKHYKILLCIAFIVLSIFLMPIIINLFKNDITNYTSTITRTYCVISSIILSIIYPFGVGNGLYLPAYINILENGLKTLEKLPFNINTSEIISIINSTSDSIIGAKSGIFQYSIYWGIIGTIYFVSFLYEIYKDIRKNKNKASVILEFGLVYLIISITFFIDFDCKYEIFAYLSVIIYYIKNNSKFINIEKLEDENNE